MVQRTERQGEGNIVFVQNNFYYDAFFLKAIGECSYLFSLRRDILTARFAAVLNGACGSSLCTAPNSSLKYHVRVHEVISLMLQANTIPSHSELATLEQPTSIPS